MDDFIIFTKTRWQLRKAVKKLNQFFNQFSFKQHPDKTFIGKIDKGFDWMGFQFTRSGIVGIVGIAQRSIEKIQMRLGQLYEQGHEVAATYIKRSLGYFIPTGIVPTCANRRPNTLITVSRSFFSSLNFLLV